MYCSQTTSPSCILLSYRYPVSRDISRRQSRLSDTRCTPAGKALSYCHSNSLMPQSALVTSMARSWFLIRRYQISRSCLLLIRKHSTQKQEAITTLQVMEMTPSTSTQDVPPREDYPTYGLYNKVPQAPINLVLRSFASQAAGGQNPNSSTFRRLVLAAKKQ